MIKRLALAAAAAGFFTAADASAWRFEFSGVLGDVDRFGPVGAGTALSGATPFTFRATFDEGADVTAPTGLPGWAAYAPIRASMTLLGDTYRVLRYGEDADAGVSVMLFEPSNVFNPGFWAAGIHANPLTSDTGIIARFGSTNSALALDDGLTRTEYGDYIGAGYVSGKPATPGPGNRCWPGGGTTCSNEPFVLFGDDGSIFELAVASRPLDGPLDGIGFDAVLAPVPLPAGLPLLAAAIAAPFLLRRRRR
jgi:hypothetical protein